MAEIISNFNVFCLRLGENAAKSSPNSQKPFCKQKYESTWMLTAS